LTLHNAEVERTGQGDLIAPAGGRTKEGDDSVDITVIGRHMEVTDAIRQYVESKAAKLPRFYDNVLSAEVILGMEADKAIVEIVVTANRKNTFVATHRDNDMYAGIDECLRKISEQLRRHKDKVRDRKGPSMGQATERTAD
jgi:putative sigma-54 modulation protein